MFGLILTTALAAAQPAPPNPPAPPAAHQGESRQITIVRFGGKDGRAAERTDTVIVRDASAERVTSLDCREDRSFETEAESGTAEKKTRTRIRVCAREGESDASYADALKRTADRIAADPDLPEGVRNQVLVALNAEIARLNVSTR
jgi:hypothetical protein